LPQLSAAEIEIILLHECAHLRRWDHWTNLAQQFVKAVFFFHPAVWWIENRLTLEREMACDDMVLAQSASPRAYASFLISFAEKVQNPQGLALMQALISRTRQMSIRVAQILDAKRAHRTALWTPLLGVGASMLAVVFGAAPYLPQFVAFQNQPGKSQPTQMQAAMAKPQPAAQATRADLMSHTVAPPVARTFDLAPQPRAIPAAYHPHAAAAPLRLKATRPNNPLAMRAQAGRKEIPSQETLVVFQTTEYDASGSGVWTLCIWRVKGDKLAERQLESAIVQII
jgi:BlaR1 peptidase M56